MHNKPNVTISLSSNLNGLILKSILTELGSKYLNQLENIEFNCILKKSVSSRYEWKI